MSERWRPVSLHRALRRAARQSARGRGRSARRDRRGRMPAVSIGSPTRMLTVDGPDDRAAPAASPRGRPEIATGTIGACALIAMMKPPFLNGSSSSVRLRVPSGKDQERVARRGSIARRPRSIASPLPCCGDRPGRSRRCRNARASSGIASISRLVEDVHPRVQRVEQDRRIDVALMVGAVDGGAVERQVLAAGDARP